MFRSLFLLSATRGALALFAAPAAMILSVPAVAQAPATATAEATALVDLMNPPAQAKAGLDSQVAAIREGQMIRAMLSQNPQFRTEAAKNQPALNGAMGRIGAAQAKSLGPIFAEMQAASRRYAIDAYARAFTAAELKSIVAFYRTPAGAKLLKQQQQVMAGISKQVQSQYGPRMEAAQKALAPTIEAELKKLFPQGGQGK